MHAVHGTTREIQILASISCPTCKKSANHKSEPILCSNCNGSGYQTYFSGTYRMNMRCKLCKGSRYTYKGMCSDCRDKGVVMARKKMSIRIPPGTAADEILRVRHPTENKYLNITIKIDDSNQFKIDKLDVFSTVFVSFTVAILGGQIKVPTIYGAEIDIKIPPSSDSDTEIRIPGKGIKHGKFNSVGDHIVVVKIQVPKKLTERQRALLNSFAKMESGETTDVDSQTTRAMKSNLLEKMIGSKSLKKSPQFLASFLK